MKGANLNNLMVKRKKEELQKMEKGRERNQISKLNREPRKGGNSDLRKKNSKAQ